VVFLARGIGLGRSVSAGDGDKGSPNACEAGISFVQGMERKGMWPLMARSGKKAIETGMLRKGKRDIGACENEMGKSGSRCTLGIRKNEWCGHQRRGEKRHCVAYSFLLGYARKKKRVTVCYVSMQSGTLEKQWDPRMRAIMSRGPKQDRTCCVLHCKKGEKARPSGVRKACANVTKRADNWGGGKRKMKKDTQALQGR